MLNLIIENELTGIVSHFSLSEKAFRQIQDYI